MSDGQPDLRTCGHCGVFAPARASVCAFCDRALTGDRPVARAPASHHWCCLRVTFECPHCAKKFPIASVETERVDCPHCAGKTPIRRSDLHALFEGAHDVADFPAANGSFDPDEDTWAEVKADRFTAIASPGAPRCDVCHGPLGVELRKDAGATLTCDTCHSRSGRLFEGPPTGAYDPLRALWASRNGDAPGRAAPLWALFEGPSHARKWKDEFAAEEAADAKKRAAEEQTRREERAHKEEQARRAAELQRAEDARAIRSTRRMSLWIGLACLMFGAWWSFFAYRHAHVTSVGWREEQCLVLSHVQEGQPAQRPLILELQMPPGSWASSPRDSVVLANEADAAAARQRYAKGAIVPCWTPDDDEAKELRVTVTKPTEPFPVHRTGSGITTLGLLAFGVGLMFLVMSRFVLPPHMTDGD